tara:strand:- start:7070 stop:7393 length:324 start_codon:yes stop_codon:yes gene_type:complete
MATTGRTRLLFSGTAAAAGSTVAVQRVGNIYGTVQCDFTTSSALGFKMEIQGRIGEALNWAILGTIDETDIDDNNAALLSVRLLPEMRAEVTSVTGSVGTITAHLLE